MASESMTLESQRERNIEFLVEWKRILGDNPRTLFDCNECPSLKQKIIELENKLASVKSKNKQLTRRERSHLDEIDQLKSNFDVYQQIMANANTFGHNLIDLTKDHLPKRPRMSPRPDPSEDIEARNNNSENEGFQSAESEESEEEDDRRQTNSPNLEGDQQTRSPINNDHSSGSDSSGDNETQSESGDGEEEDNDNEQAPDIDHIKIRRNQLYLFNPSITGITPETAGSLKVFDPNIKKTHPSTFDPPHTLEEVLRIKAQREIIEMAPDNRDTFRRYQRLSFAGFSLEDNKKTFHFFWFSKKEIINNKSQIRTCSVCCPCCGLVLCDERTDTKYSTSTIKKHWSTVKHYLQNSAGPPVNIQLHVPEFRSRRIKGNTNNKITYLFANAGLIDQMKKKTDRKGLGKWPLVKTRIPPSGVLKISTIYDRLVSKTSQLNAQERQNYFEELQNDSFGGIESTMINNRNTNIFHFFWFFGDSLCCPICSFADVPEKTLNTPVDLIGFLNKHSSEVKHYFQNQQKRHEKEEVNIRLHLWNQEALTNGMLKDFE